MPPRRNYGFEKRQKDQARKDKQAEKLQRKRELSVELSRALGEHGFLIPVLSKGRA